MRDLLIRYLLGELDDAAQRQLEERLRQSPELRRELAHLQSCFSAGETDLYADAASDPPPGLAARTSEQVSSLSGESPALPPRPPIRTAVEASSAPATWSLADISVAAGVMLAVSMLLLPALRGSRDTSRRTGCANNQREIGYLLARYAVGHNGYFPRIEPRDRAGTFASHLVDEDYISREKMAKLLVCRASKQGDAAAAGRLRIVIPTVVELRSAKPWELKHLLARMDYSYAYPLGYKTNNSYHCVRYRRRACQPILADAPGFDARGPKIASHNGCGVNVLFADAHVGFQKILTVPGFNDHLYLNDGNEAAAGQSPNDVVLGTSGSTPSPESAE